MSKYLYKIYYFFLLRHRIFYCTARIEKINSGFLLCILHPNTMYSTLLQIFNKGDRNQVTESKLFSLKGTKVCSRLPFPMMSCWSVHRQLFFPTVTTHTPLLRKAKLSECYHHDLMKQGEQGLHTKILIYCILVALWMSKYWFKCQSHWNPFYASKQDLCRLLFDSYWAQHLFTVVQPLHIDNTVNHTKLGEPLCCTGSVASWQQQAFLHASWSQSKHGDVEMVCKKEQLTACKETSSNRVAYSAPQNALYPSKKECQIHRLADQHQYNGP